MANIEKIKADLSIRIVNHLSKNPISQMTICNYKTKTYHHRRRMLKTLEISPIRKNSRFKRVIRFTFHRFTLRFRTMNSSLRFR